MLWQPNLNLLNISLMASCLGYSMGFMFASYIIPALLGCSYCADAHLRLIMQQQQQQQHSLFSQASWGRLEMKPERNKFKVQAH